MKRVLVLGCSGSGKSTFSKQLAERSGLPIVHLDSLYWKSGWVESTVEEWNAITAELIQQDTYIMDGNYSRTLAQRLQAADTVFFFDFSRYRCIYRVIKRRIQNHGQTREDMAEGCLEKIDWEFIMWIWNFKARSRAKVLSSLAEVQGEKEVYIFRNPREVRAYLKTYPTTKA